jgi:hypothetical protein
MSKRYGLEACRWTENGEINKEVGEGRWASLGWDTGPYGNGRRHVRRGACAQLASADENAALTNLNFESRDAIRRPSNVKIQSSIQRGCT